ncbi:meiosis-specific kinetochore protein [Tiliqua scincoides]|uniref:meiosis-specific kinetochore protein n=1 Tax=Tiliqua scincoides TaxID=71010 RepID=UPI0034631B1A
MTLTDGNISIVRNAKKMEWPNLRSYSHKRRAPKNMRCASPVPGIVASSALGRRRMTTKAPPLCLPMLSKPKQRPCAKKHIGNANTKVLPEIQENSEVTQMDCLSAERRVELNYNENRGLDTREHISESSAILLKASSHLSSASKESLQNSEATSEMTLPSGVSDFLLDCLDMDSTVGPGLESSDKADSYSSPEIFRDDSGVEENSVSSEECLGCKNSTLLNTSKAINIEKMPQPSNLSKIFGNFVHEIGSRAVITRKNNVLETSTAVLQLKDLESLRNPPEICCIITASPDFTPPKVLKRPLNKKRLFPLSGVTEDIITSPKNWVYNHDRCIGLQNMTEDTCIKSGGKAGSG